MSRAVWRGAGGAWRRAVAPGLILACLTGCVAQYRKNLLPAASPTPAADLADAAMYVHVDARQVDAGAHMWHGTLSFCGELVRGLGAVGAPIGLTPVSGSSPLHRDATKGARTEERARREDELWIECAVSQIEEGGAGMRLLRALPSILTVTILPSWLNTIRADVEVTIWNGRHERLWHRSYRDAYGGVLWLFAMPFASPYQKAPDQIIANMAALATNDIVGAGALAGATVTPRLAARRLRDQGELAKVALASDDAEARAVAVQKVAAPELIAEVARKDPDPGVRLEAVKRVAAPELIAEVARKDPDPGVRLEAVRRLGDQALLASLAVEDPDRYVRLAAEDRLTKGPLLDRVVASRAPTSSDPLEVALGYRRGVTKLAQLYQDVAAGLCRQLAGGGWASRYSGSLTSTSLGLGYSRVTCRRSKPFSIQFENGVLADYRFE